MARFDLRDFKKQASFFLREKLNDARLALTDVSRIQLLTEEATNEDSWGPETRTMAILADAAFELEEYERIVQVIHRRLEPSKRGHWRQLYKTLVVLEYLLLHGPNSIGREFRGDSTSVEELSQFNFTDRQGIDRGSIVRKKADRVLELINNADLRKEECTRARKISVDVRGFGSSTNLELFQNVGKATEQESGHGNFEDSWVPCEKPSEVMGSGAMETFQNGPKRAPYEKCISITPQPRHAVSSNSLFEENATAMSKTSEQKDQTKVFKKCLSSPGYFRGSFPARLSRQPADVCIDEADEVNTSLLDAVEEREISSCNNLQEGEEPGILTTWTSGEFTEDGNINSSHESAFSMFGNINTRSLAGNCKSSMQIYEGDQQFLNFSNRHNLPYPVRP